MTDIVTIKEWEGYVISIEGETFWARLSDVKSETYETLEAEFSIRDVGLYDKNKVKEGAIFRWVIERHIERGGTVNTNSRLVFRDLPRFSSTRQHKKTSLDDVAWE